VTGGRFGLSEGAAPESRSKSSLSQAFWAAQDSWSFVEAVPVFNLSLVRRTGGYRSLMVLMVVLFVPRQMIVCGNP
jgi:hypothetical protein